MTCPCLRLDMMVDALSELCIAVSVGNSRPEHHIFPFSTRLESLLKIARPARAWNIFRELSPLGDR